MSEIIPPAQEQARHIRALLIAEIRNPQFSLGGDAPIYPMYKRTIKYREGRFVSF